jgi:hypothetical protein
VTQQWNVPSEAMRNGDFRQLVNTQNQLSVLYDPWSTDSNTWARIPFPNNTIPSNRQSPLSKRPHCHHAPAHASEHQSECRLQLGWSGSHVSTKLTTSSRIDHRFSEKDQFYGRYTQGTSGTSPNSTVSRC